MTTTQKFYGLSKNDTQSFSRYTITLTKTEYQRTESGKNWAKNPVSETTEVVNFENYLNVLSSVDFFKNLGGKERVEKNYTVAGYIPTRITSVSPDGTKKIIRHYRIEQ